MWEPELSRRFSAIVAAETARDLDAIEALLGRPLADDELEPRNLAYRAAGRRMSAADYLEARSWIALWSRRMAQWWSSYDVLVTSTLCAPPPPLGWFTEDGPRREGARIASLVASCAQFNMTGQPAVSLPLHATSDGLPIGIQFAASYGREDLLVRLAAQLEAAAPWSGRRPVLAA
jgi:amidase